MTQKNERNNKQDTEIAVLKADLKNLAVIVEKFILNEFTHLKGKVDKILVTIVIGFLVSILTILIAKLV